MYDILNLPDFTFPKDFLWGAATAAHQIEGNNTNSDWWANELAGKHAEPSGMACNSYQLYRDDVALLASLGMQAYRFSVEWARIEPTEGEFSAEATEHYIDQCRCLLDRGIQPWVTLHHFTNPQWFAARGEWHQRENLDAFYRYVDYITPKLAPFVSGWTPINEYNLGGGMPPDPAWHVESGKKKFNQLLADTRTYDIIKSHSSAPIGSSIAYVAQQPQRQTNELDTIMAQYTAWVSYGFYYHAIRTGEWLYPFIEGGYFPELKGRADLWAINMYTRNMVDSRRAKLDGARYLYAKLPLIEIDFYHDEFSPDALLFNMHKLTDKPVYITENGACCNDDRFRVAYIALHLAAFHQAIQDGVDLRGWFYWSLLDNYEWGSYLPLFGITKVDRNTFERTPKPSARMLKDIITRNGLSGALVRKYLDRLPSQTDDMPKE